VKKITKIVIIISIIFIWVLLNLFIDSKNGTNERNSFGTFIFLIFIISLIKYIWNRPIPKDLHPSFPQFQNYQKLKGGFNQR
jgi:hypothetical protein